VQSSGSRKTLISKFLKISWILWSMKWAFYSFCL